MKRAVILALCASLGGCAVKVPLPPLDSPPATDPLFVPDQVRPGGLAYAPDRSTFPPMLTERFPYPTQTEANDAFLRAIAVAPDPSSMVRSVWLFGCKPGSLDEQTARITRFSAPIVHCATDFLDREGRRVARRTVNFTYADARWTLETVSPPVTAVPWLHPEHSPRDPGWWFPGRDRYE